MIQLFQLSLQMIDLARQLDALLLVRFDQLFGLVRAMEHRLATSDTMRFSRLDELVEFEEDLDRFSDAFQSESTESIHVRVNSSEGLAGEIERCRRVERTENILERYSSSRKSSTKKGVSPDVSPSSICRQQSVLHSSNCDIHQRSKTRENPHVEDLREEIHRSEWENACLR